MRIAIIGNIGSGKTTFAKRLAEQLGCECISADEINRTLLTEPQYIALLSEAFPDAVTDGKLNKRVLADIVFSDRKLRARLNRLSHPYIKERILSDISASGDFAVVELPLFEADEDYRFDRIVCVCATENTRFARVMARNGLTPDEVEARIGAQPKEEVLRACATDIVINDGDLQKLLLDADTLATEIKQKS